VLKISLETSIINTYEAIDSIILLIKSIENILLRFSLSLTYFFLFRSAS
jgi:hypothetical protein